MDTIELNKKVLQYETFVNDVLKEDLRKLENQLDSVTLEIAQFMELQNMIRGIKEADLTLDGYKAKVDIGCNFYMQAKVEDSSTIFVDIGLGLFIEFTSEEALKFVSRKTEFLTKQENFIRKQIAKVKGNIKLVLLGIDELQKCPKEEKR